MTHIYSLYPFFSETALLSALDDVSQQEQRSIRSSEYWLLYMALAIGSVAQSQSSQDAFYKDGVEYAARAMEHADRALAPGHVTQIQSLLLLTIFSMLDPVHFDSWHLIGLTCRSVIDLGFHQDPPSTHQIDKATLDMRRKTFYCVYALDRYAFPYLVAISACTNVGFTSAISMVHVRAFSFTDDAINVAFPSMSGMGRIPSASGPITGPQSANPAILLFQLRRAQSQWYQALYESDPNDPLVDAPSYIWQMCHEMREWSEALPETLPIGIRELFDLELKYSYVFCIAPSPRAPHIADYGRMLIFEYVISYVDRIMELAHGPANPALYTYHDALRVFFMGGQFISVLRDAGDSLLASTSVPIPLPLPGKAPPPPMPARSPGDNLDRSILCIERVSLTLARYGERWHDAQSLAATWDLFSREVAGRLRARLQYRRTQPPPTMLSTMSTPMMNQQQMQVPAPLFQQQMMPPQGVQPELEWVDMDIQQMLTRGGL